MSLATLSGVTALRRYSPQRRNSLASELLQIVRAQRLLHPWTSPTCGGSARDLRYLPGLRPRPIFLARLRRTSVYSAATIG